MTKRPGTHVDKNGILHWTGVLIVDDSPESADWIKVAEWDRTFSEEEHHLLDTYAPISSNVCRHRPLTEAWTSRKWSFRPDKR